MKARVVLAAATAAVALAGCGAGTPTDDRRAVGSFRSIDVSDGVDVHVVHGAVPAVTVHAGHAVVDRVDTKVSGGVLHVGVHDRGIVIGRDPLRGARVRVALPSVSDVRVSGSSDVELSGVSATSLHLELNGNGDLTARGRVDHLDAEVAGPGDARLAGLTARTARVAVHGSADVDLRVTDALAIEVHGPGDVTYRGRPRVTQDVSGAADITHVGP